MTSMLPDALTSVSPSSCIETSWIGSGTSPREGEAFAPLALFGFGTASLLRLSRREAWRSEATGWLASIDGSDYPGPAGAGPVAIGALPFDLHERGLLAVPRIAIGYSRAGEIAWCTLTAEPSTISESGLDRALQRLAKAPSASALVELARSAGAHDTSREPGTGYHRRRVSCYRAANPEAGLALEIPVDITAMTRFRRELDEACQLVSEGKLKKLVLALAAPVRSSSGAPLTREELLAALWSSQVSPMSSRFAVGPLVGSSPELLISRRGPLVKSRPLAGTRPRGRGGELLSSTKDLLEHSLVVDDITARLRPFCTVEPRAVGPVAVEVPGLSHLATDISGELSPSPGIPSSGHGTSYPSALDLVLAIHPTPAISGIPRAEALRSIASIEARPRGFYGGVVGWVDSRGDGDWMLAIRSLQLGDEPDAVLAFAGAGIVPGSDADTELAEVYSKLTAILSLFE